MRLFFYGLCEKICLEFHVPREVNKMRSGLAAVTLKEVPQISFSIPFQHMLLY